MDTENRPSTCDTCGKPATSFARDLIKRPNANTGNWEASPSSYVKAGCEDHPVTSETHRSYFSLLAEE